MEIIDFQIEKEYKSSIMVGPREVLHGIGGIFVGATMGTCIDLLLIANTPEFTLKTPLLYAILILLTGVGGATGRFGGRLADSLADSDLPPVTVRQPRRRMPFL